MSTNYDVASFIVGLDAELKILLNSEYENVFAQVFLEKTVEDDGLCITLVVNNGRKYSNTYRRISFEQMEYEDPYATLTHMLKDCKEIEE